MYTEEDAWADVGKTILGFILIFFGVTLLIVSKLDGEGKADSMFHNTTIIHKEAS